MLLLDLDDMKGINDLYGHLQGNRAMTGNGAVFDFCGPFSDGDGINEWSTSEYTLATALVQVQSQGRNFGPRFLYGFKSWCICRRV